MEPEQALATLDQVVALAPVNRATHVRVQEAVQALDQTIKNWRGLLKENEKEKGSPEDPKETGEKKTKDEGAKPEDK